MSPLLGGGLVGGDRPVLRRWHCDSIGGDLLDGEHPWEVRDVGIVVPIGDGRPGGLDGHRSGFAHVRGGHIGEAGGLGQGIRPHQAGDGVVRRRESGDGIANAGGFVFDLDGEGAGRMVTGTGSDSTVWYRSSPSFVALTYTVPTFSGVSFPVLGSMSASPVPISSWMEKVTPPLPEPPTV